VLCLALKAATMMDAKSSLPTDSARKGATKEPVENATSTLGSSKPTDVDVDAHVDRRDAEEKSFGQAQTPKHANKTMGGREDSSPMSPGRNFPRDKGNQKITPDRSDGKAMGAPNYPTQEKAQQGHAQQRLPQGYYASGEPAYGQYRSQQQPMQHDPHHAARFRMHPGATQPVSTGGRNMGAAYRQQGYGAPGYNMHARYPQESQGYRQQQGQYAQAPRYDQQAGYGGVPQGQAYEAYMQDRRGHVDGSTHPQYGQGIPRPYQGRHGHYASQQTPVGHEYDPRYVDQHGNVSGVTRAVSSSFDRSIKSTENQKSGIVPGGPSYYSQQVPQSMPPIKDGGSVEASDDDSWRQLKQVASVDDNMIRARIAQQKAEKAKSSSQSSKASPPSNSSSLTNSPTDGAEAKSKLAALDSLSSVASGQEPIDTVGSKDGKTSKEMAGHSSPSSSTQSLDLMKCHSGSSGLLHGFPGTHGRSLSGVSFQAQPDLLRVDSKRSLEDRGDADTKLGVAADGGRHGPSDEPPSKKIRVDGKEGDKMDFLKSSLPVECSPPNSLSEAKAPQDNRLAGRHSFNTSPAYMGGSYFDRAPSYTYSIESVPSKEYAGNYPSLPARSGSSSSTITPAGSTSMQIDGPVALGDTHQREGVGTLPSWDIINAQDSFGAGSMAGGASAVLGGNFSFGQDYPLLSGSGSNLGTTGAAPVPVSAPLPQGQQGRHHGPPTSLAESRNQSFEGGHYHGNFGRSSSENMEMSYNLPPGVGARPGVQPQFQEGYKQCTGQFPPQAPSWGTASSSNSTHQAYGGYPSSQYRPPSQYQVPQPPRAYAGGAMMRNYSEDSAMRTSPPPSNARASGFAPPPEFSAPHNPQLARRPPPAVYIMSSGAHSNQTDPTMSTNATGGVYGWSQEEDDLLTEVMKKYKNPRDWEPISKEHGCNKT
jgi:hypothetical protein